MNRKIKFLVLHCSDSDQPLHDNIETIRQWHTARGFIGPDGIGGNKDDVGYHFFIDRKGAVHVGRNENEIGAHVKNHNKFTLGICLSGRTFKDFHTNQFIMARKLVEQLIDKYHLTRNDVKLHRELDAGKTCPNFTIKQFWQY